MDRILAILLISTFIWGTVFLALSLAFPLLGFWIPFVIGWAMGLVMAIVNVLFL